MRGDLEPYGLVVESSIPNDAMAGDGFFAGEGEEDDRPVSVGQWLRRLAPGAAFVVALGDCGVWGGLHSLFPNPTGSTGVLAHLGSGYRSTLGLPVLNLPGCALPPVLIRTLIAILQFAEGQQPAPQLDAMNRPAETYRDVWPGALSVWKG